MKIKENEESQSFFYCSGFGANISEIVDVMKKFFFPFFGWTLV